MIDQKDDQRIDEEIYTHSPLPLRISVSSDVINQTKPQSTKFSMFAFAFSIGATCYILFLIGYLIYLKQQIYPIRNANNLHRYTEISEISQFIEENDSKCEKEWKFLQDEDIGFCYRAWATPGISFESAKTMCRSYDANVVSSIRSHSEDVFVQNVALGAPTITKIWIGLEMNWGLRHWQNRDPHITYGTAIYGVDSLNQRVSAFMSDEQMRFVAKCIRCKQRKMNGLWYFVGLNESLNETYRPDGVVCKKRIRRPPIKYTIKSNESCDIGWAHNEHTGFCYYLQNYKPLLNESQLFTWNEAESDCKKRGSHLVSIHSLEEREFVKDLITSDLQSQLPEQSWFDGCTLGHGVWIGLHRVNGRIMNTDGSASRFFPSLHSQHDEDGYWWMCNDRANTYPEAIQTTYDWGQVWVVYGKSRRTPKMSRYVCKKAVNK